MQLSIIFTFLNYRDIVFLQTKRSCLVGWTPAAKEATRRPLVKSDMQGY
jgi:hypothetical protein